MTEIFIDFTGVRPWTGGGGLNHHPPGAYDFTVDCARIDVSTAGNDMVVVDLRLGSDSQLDLRLTDYIVFEWGLPRLRELLMCQKLVLGEDLLTASKFDPDILSGAAGICIIADRPTTPTLRYPERKLVSKVLTYAPAFEKVEERSS